MRLEGSGLAQGKKRKSDSEFKRAEVIISRSVERDSVRSSGTHIAYFYTFDDDGGGGGIWITNQKKNRGGIFQKIWHSNTDQSEKYGAGCSAFSRIRMTGTKTNWWLKLFFFSLIWGLKKLYAHSICELKSRPRGFLPFQLHSCVASSLAVTKNASGAENAFPRRLMRSNFLAHSRNTWRRRK